MSPSQGGDQPGHVETLSSPSSSSTQYLALPSQHAQWSSLQRQKRDMPPLAQLISPPFVLAPRGLNLAMINAMPASINSVNSIGQQFPESQIAPMATSTERVRPISWGYVVGPIMIVLAIAIITGLLLAYRRGKRTTRNLARLQAGEGEEKWREATRKEVEQLAEDTANQAVRSMKTPNPVAITSTPRRLLPSASRPDPVGQYAYLQSEVGYTQQSAPLQPLCRAMTKLSSSSSEETRSSSHSSLYRPLRYCVPYKTGAGQHWRSNISDVDSDAPLLTHEQTIQSSALTPLPPAIPASLRPRSISNNTALVNPFDVFETKTQLRPSSLPLQVSNFQPHRSLYRAFSSGAAEKSSTTGRIGSASACIS